MSRSTSEGRSPTESGTGTGAASAGRIDPVDRFVGARITARRLAMGLSQTALAARLGVSFQQVQKYESGANRVSASRLHRIAAVLEAAPADFFPEPSGPTSAFSSLRFLTATAEGRAVAAGFPLIADRRARRAVARIVAVLAAPQTASQTAPGGPATPAA